MSGQEIDANATIIDGLMSVSGGESLLENDAQRRLYRLMREPMMGNDKPNPRRVVLA